MKKIITLFVLMCSSWSLLTAQCPTPPNLIVPPNTIVLDCNTTSTSLVAESSTPGVAWAWTGPNGFASTQQYPLVSLPGTYTVVVTEPVNGCTATNTVFVFQNFDPPFLDIVPNAGNVCFSGPTTLGATSIPGATFLWSNGASTQIITVSQPAFYTVTATDPSNGCTSTATVNVQQGAPPIAVVPPNLELSCTSPSIQVPITCTPATCQIIQSNGQILPGNIMEISQAGTYTVTLFDPATGCSSLFSFTVAGGAGLALAIDHENLYCNSESATITTITPSQNVNYLWSTNETTPNIEVTTPGNYTVTVTSATTGCTNVVFAEVLLLSDEMDISVSTTCTGTGGGIIINTTPGLEVIWDNGSTDPQLLNLANGTYCVTVTNPDRSCTVDTCINFVQPPAFMVNLQPVATQCDPIGGGVVTEGIGGVQPFTYFWSNGINSGGFGIPVPLIPGNIFSVTATDATGCTAVDSLLILSSSIDVTASINYGNCTSNATLLANGAIPPYQFLLSNGQTFPNQTAPLTLNNLPNGSYAVTVTDNQGCTAATNFIIQMVGCQQLLEGTLRNDLNTNCIAELNEQGIISWVIRALNVSTQEDYFGLTNSQGYYSIGLPLGTYTIEAIPPNAIWQTCPLQQVSFTAPDTITLDLPAQALVNCPVLEVNLNAGLMRRCFQGHYNLSYCNIGTATATNAYVDLTLDPFLTLNSTTHPNTSLGNNVYRFNVGDVAPGACGSIGITVNVSCNAALGQAHCSEAHAYPDSICIPPSANWSGAQVSANATCNTDSIRFTIRNTGTGTMTNQLDYIVIEDGILRQAGNGAPLAPNGTMQITVPANGSTWRLEANQEPNHPVLPDAIVNVEGCLNGAGVFSTGFVNQFVLPDPMPWLDIDCTPNTGSYDPNDKAGVPIGYGNLHYIEPDTRIDYLIRFQNTGTDTAFTVVIADTLAQQLDPCTFRLLGSSHPMTHTLTGSGNLEFRFDQIMLPDSNVNEPASHGFVRFSIAPRPGLPLETDVFNEASIYFDFNAPVVTNRTQHRLGRNYVVVKLFEIDAYLQAGVAPNPTTGQAYIQWEAFGAFQLTVTDALGKVILLEKGTGNMRQLDVSNWKSGLYLIQVHTSEGKRYLAKLMKTE